MDRNLTTFIKENYQNALDQHHIQAYYQPVIRTISRKLCSFEALARWIDPDLGIIYPDEFIPVLEEIEQIHLLDAYIIREACTRIRLSINKGETPVPISINLSRLDFHLCDVFEVVDSIVSEYQIPHDFLYIEITESVMAEQKDLMLEIVKRFCSSGYQVWMDDFGSAYSSLNILKEYTFNELKLDMCFLRPWNEKSKRIATSVIEMAKHINIHTLAEGVENEEQFRYFRNIGCEKVQGYYFGKPMLYEESMEHLRAQDIYPEPPQDRKYYDDIGRVDILSAVPFMTQEERDALVTARQLNSIPLALLEFEPEQFRVLFYNTAFETIASGTGMIGLVFDQSMLGMAFPNRVLSDRILNLMDSTRSREEGRMYFTSHQDYFEITAKCVAQMKGKYAVLVRMVNLSKDSKSASTDLLNEYLLQIYSLYERITMIDVANDTVTPLYISSREHLVSDTSGIKVLSKEYAEKYIFPSDRAEYLAFVNPDTVQERFDNAGKTFQIRILRSSVRHGSYAWKAYTLLRVDQEQYLMLIGNVHEAMKIFEIEEDHLHDSSADAFSPASLWRNLVGSDLLRIFWKDKNRKFVGASRAFLDYYSFPSAEAIIGKNDEEVGWHIHPDAYMNDEERVIREGITTHNIPGRCMNEGENKQILASKTPLYDENGEIAGLLGYFIDKELLTVNDRRGTETNRRDLLTGLLNTRGIAEEATAFRDEYYLRGTDFARIHISIDDFSSLNEQYGFDYGDKLMAALGIALKKAFGRTCAVGRYAGQRFVVLHQVSSREEVHDLRTRIKEIGSSVKEIDGIPVTLYLSVGFVLFSEYLDLEEQSKKAELRLLADHDHNAPQEGRVTRSGDIFHLFDDLPVIYAVYHVPPKETGRKEDTVLFYVNHKYEQACGMSAESILGKNVFELWPIASEEWYQKVQRTAWEKEPEEGILADGANRYHYAASQIIYPGYCAVIYQKLED